MANEGRGPEKGKSKEPQSRTGALPTYEIAEESLKKWIFDQREREICVTPYDVKSHMKR